MAGGPFELIGAAAGLAGSKPNVPAYNPVSAQAAQSKAITGNIGALPGAESLAAATNVFNEDQLQAMLAKAIPNYAGMQKAQSDAILSMIKGEIPDANQIAIKAASKAVAGGFGGSEAGRNLTMRDLSMSSLAATQAGLSAADRWTRTSAAVGVANPMSPSSMFITPAQQIAVDESNAANEWQRNWLSSQVKAMPSPLESAGMGALGFLDQVAGTAAGGYLGGMMGGGAAPKSPGFSTLDWAQQNRMAAESGMASPFSPGSFEGDINFGSSRNLS